MVVRAIEIYANLILIVCREVDKGAKRKILEKKSNFANKKSGQILNNNNIFDAMSNNVCGNYFSIVDACVFLFLLNYFISSIYYQFCYYFYSVHTLGMVALQGWA